MNAEGHIRQCSAWLSNRTRRCLRYAVKGTTTCPTHGASAPQVQRSARRRLNDLVDPSINNLEVALQKAAKQGAELSTPALRCCALILDRSGYHPRAEVDLDVKLSEETGGMIADVIQGVLRDLGVNRPDAGMVIRRHLERVAGANGHGLPADRSWAEFLTIEERKAMIEIQERCFARAEGRAPESGNGHEKEKASQAPPPQRKVSKTLDEVETL